MLNFILIVILFLALILPLDLIVIFTPILVYLATGFANWLKITLGSTGFNGTVLITIVAPLFSLLASWLVEVVAQPDLNFWVLFALGLLGVFVNEFLKQWSQTIKGKQTPANNKLIG